MNVGNGDETTRARKKKGQTKHEFYIILRIQTTFRRRVINVDKYSSHSLESVRICV